MTNSTLRAFTNAQNSSKSGARSNELSPQEFNGRDAFSRRTAPPVVERSIGLRFLPEGSHRQVLAVEAEFHATILCDSAAGSVP